MPFANGIIMPRQVGRTGAADHLVGRFAQGGTL